MPQISSFRRPWRAYPIAETEIGNLSFGWFLSGFLAGIAIPVGVLGWSLMGVNDRVFAVYFTLAIFGLAVLVGFKASAIFGVVKAETTFEADE